MPIFKDNFKRTLKHYYDLGLIFLFYERALKLYIVGLGSIQKVWKYSSQFNKGVNFKPVVNILVTE